MSDKCTKCQQVHGDRQACHICNCPHIVGIDLHGKPWLKMDSVHMPGWHTWTDGLVRRLEWVGPHRFTVTATVESVDAIPPAPETEMDRYFREHPDASTD